MAEPIGSPAAEVSDQDFRAILDANDQLSANGVCKSDAVLGQFFPFGGSARDGPQRLLIPDLTF